MSPTWGLEKRSPIRFTRTRWPTCRVGTIDSDGIRYGLTRKAWMPRASPRATATIRTSSMSDPEVDEDDPFFAATPLYSLAGLLVTAGRRLGVGGRLRLGNLGSGQRLLVDGLAGDLGVGRCGGFGRRVVEQAALDDLLRARV